MRKHDIERIKQFAKDDESVLRGALTISAILNGKLRSPTCERMSGKWAIEKTKAGVLNNVR